MESQIHEVLDYYFVRVHGRVLSSNNSLPIIIGFLEILYNNSTVRCGWSWSHKSTLRFKIFALGHQKKEQDHGFVHFKAEQDN